MPFNPDRFLADTDPDTGRDSSFDPDKFLADTAPAPEEEGFLKQAGRATVNSLPMLGGVAGGILGTPADALTGPVGTAVGAGIGGYLGTAAKNMINSYIDPQNSPRTAGEAILDPLVGGAEQGLGQATGEALAGPISAGASKISPVVAEYLNRIAETRAAKALGATKAAFKKFGEDSLRKVGRYGLDEGVITPLASTDAMMERNAATQANAMQARKGVYDAIDSGAPGAPTGGHPETVRPDYSAVNPSEMTPRKINGAPEYTDAQISQLGQASGAAADTNLAAANESGFNPYGKAGTTGSSQYNPMEAAQAVQKAAGVNSSPLNQGAKSQLDKIIEAIQMRGTDNISMADAQALQEEIQNAAKFDTTRSSGANDVAKAAAGAHREYLNQAAENAADQVGGQDFKQTLQNSNRQYSMGARAGDLLENKAAGELGNKTFGLTDTIAGSSAGTAAMLGHPVAALAGAAGVGAKKFGEKFGNQSVAVGADFVKNLVQSAPQSLGKWAAPLTQAAERGGNSLAATDYILQQTDPEYRQHLQSLKGSPDEDQ